MSGKTPVSILTELCVSKHSRIPDFDLVCNQSNRSDVVFTYRVLALGQEAEGSGRSKKEAKQEAARILLEQMKHSSSADFEGVNPIDEDIEIASPYTNELKQNAVGLLQEFCNESRLPNPEYKVINEEGPPHDKTFTMIVTVSKMSESGISRTKKQAKHLAALKMLNKLRELTCIDDPDSKILIKSSEFNNKAIQENIERAKEVFKECSLLINVKRPAIGGKISDYHLSLLNRVGSVTEEIQKIPYEEMTEELFLEFLTEQNIQFEYCEIPTNDKDMLLYMLEFSTTPVFVCHGQGRDEDMAKKNALNNSMEFFWTMMKPINEVKCDL